MFVGPDNCNDNVCDSCGELDEAKEGEVQSPLTRVAELEGALEKSLNWMEWIKRKNQCTCEQNVRCVKCVVTEEIKAAEQALKEQK